MNAFMQLNMSFLHLLANLRSDVLTGIMRFFTLFGEEVIAIVLLCALYWCINKRLSFVIGISFFVSGALVQGLKIIFRVPRPWALDTSFIAIEAEKLKVLTSYSFPSGHTQAAASIFGTLGLAAKKTWQKILCFGLVVLVGFSRMYLGVHTPLDVVISLILVLCISWVCLRLFSGAPSRGRDIAATLVVLGLSAALLCVAFGLAASGQLTAAYTVDSAKQAGAAIGFVLGAYIERHHINFDTHTRRAWTQVLKCVAGIAGVLLIKEGLKPLFALLGSEAISGFTRYFLLVFWVAALYPLIIKAVSSRAARKQGS